jgi:methanethiol oxidase
MPRWTPDPTFYPSPRLAAKAPAETLAYVAAFAPRRDVPDAIAVVDVDPTSPTYAKIVGGVDMPKIGDELHHYGWNACSSCLCPNAPHPHVERRYLVVPGLRLIPHLHHRHQTRPEKSLDRAGDRAGGDDRGHRL